MLMLIAGLAGLATASLLRGDAKDQFLVVAAPWASSAEAVAILAESDGALLEAGGFENIVIAASTSPDFPSSARKAGAWLVLPAPRQSGCLSESGELTR